MNPEITENLVGWAERTETTAGIPRHIHTAMYECPMCGALVSSHSLDLHLEWHGKYYDT